MSQPCQVCLRAHRDGWWGEGHAGTHCRDCHTSWAGLNEQHCVVCHRHFTNIKAADAHRVNGACQDPATLRRENGSAVLVPSTRRRRYPVVTWALADGRQTCRDWPQSPPTAVA
jgi:hypothetical protein